MPRTPTVLLFDIDGTLVSTGGAGRRALERAFEAFASRRDACDAFDFGGMTDRAIVRRGLVATGREPAESAIDAVLDLYLGFLDDEVRRTPRYVVHDGVLDALDAASMAERVAIGLGTGNIRRGAALKLAPRRLFERFSFGGFGCDHEDRPSLLRIGATRGAAALGVPFEECRVVVIGDTPRDIAAANAIGAECIAVATGGDSLEALRACGPTLACEHLGVDGVIDAILVGR